MRSEEVNSRLSNQGSLERDDSQYSAIVSAGYGPSSNSVEGEPWQIWIHAGGGYGVAKNHQKTLSSIVAVAVVL